MSAEVRFPMSFENILAGQSTCRSCGASITWRKYQRARDGKPSRMPMELKTAIRQPDGTRMLESHFAHCPDAGGWRKEGGEGGAP